MLFSGPGAGSVALGHVRRSSNSSLVHARGSGRYIHEDRPQLVVEAVRQVVSAARSRTPLAACSDTRLPSLGGECVVPDQR